LIIAVVAVSLSLVSYQYASYNSQKIVDLANNEIRTNSDVKAHDISKIIENKFDKINAVLSTLATAPAIHNAEIPRGYDIVNLRQESTKEITDAIFWLDKDGKMLWSSKFAGNQSKYDKYKGTDFSSMEYFTEPKKTGKTFYSNIIETAQNIPKVYISMPIIEEQQVGGSAVFKGVIATDIKTDTVAEVVKADLSKAFQSEALLLDKAGTVMYSANQSNVGRNVFSPDYRSYIYSTAALESKDAIDLLLADLSQGKAGSREIKFNQTYYTTSYSPVTIDGNSSLMLYVISPHNLTTEVSLLIDQQKNVSAAIIAAIRGVSISIAFLIVSWNRRLHSFVEERTVDLKGKTDELENANAKLLLHDKMQQEFINVAAHELRTPIQPLLGVTELIQQSMDSKDSIEITRDDVEMLVRNAKRLERLSSDILEVSRIEGRSLKLNKERLDLNEKIQQVIKDVKSFVPSHKSVDLVFESKAAEPAVVEADKTRLFEVLSNILRNAINFTEKGSILVTLEERNDQAVVTVRDTGRGIDSEIFPKLFTKFVTKSEQGTGLGLYLSKGIIEAHGGKIWAENNPDGKGATFTFTLPLAKRQAEPDHVEFRPG
jgi:signal transduction histidine kinase